jgi:hypothetical protein
MSTFINQKQIALVPKCLDFDPYMSFAQVVHYAQIELDLIQEGQEAAGFYTKPQVKQIQKFVRDYQNQLKSQ